MEKFTTSKTPDEFAPAILYRTCDIPLERYIQIVVDRDLSALVVESGTGPAPDDDQLREAERAINAELADLTGDQSAASTYANVTRKCEIEARITAVTLLVATAKILPLEKLLAELRQYDFGVDLDPADPVALAADLDRILIELKVDEVELLELNAQLSKEPDDELQDMRPALTRKYFDDMLLAFESIMNGPQYDTTITLRKYAALCRRLEAKIKAEKRHARSK